MNTFESFSPDPTEVTGSIDLGDSNITWPNTLAASEEPQAGVSYTPRLTISRELSNVDAADETDYPNATIKVIGILPAPVPPTPEKLIRS